MAIPKNNRTVQFKSLYFSNAWRILAIPKTIELFGLKVCIFLMPEVYWLFLKQYYFPLSSFFIFQFVSALLAPT